MHPSDKESARRLRSKYRKIEVRVDNLFAAFDRSADGTEKSFAPVHAWAMRKVSEKHKRGNRFGHSRAASAACIPHRASAPRTRSQRFRAARGKRPGRVGRGIAQRVLP